MSNKTREEAMQLLIDLFPGIKRIEGEMQPEYILEYEGATIRITYQQYKETYYFGLIFKQPELRSYSYAHPTFQALYDKAGLKEPNTVHKPSKNSVTKWLNALAECNRIINTYYETRVKEIETDHAEIDDFTDNKRTYKSGKAIRVYSNLFTLTYDFSDFFYTQKRLEYTGPEYSDNVAEVFSKAVQAGM